MLDWYDVVAVSAAIIMVWVLLRPAVRDAELWRATVTPLASIIGSGFLVVAPLLAVTVGSAALLAMFAIVALSLFIGNAIRYNIRGNGRDFVSNSVSGTVMLERLSGVAVALAYVVSVAFYIRLLASFVLSFFSIESAYPGDALATAVLLFIGFYGRKNGLRGLERLEEYSVTVKLAIIVSLLLWLIYHNVVFGYPLNTLPVRDYSLWEQIRILAGMILIVQGFETSKYLGSEYSPTVRARTMFWAQILASIIYLVFIALVMPYMVNLNTATISETSLIDAVAVITVLLPPLLVIAAVMSQFSAAIADTLGAGGVLEEESKNRLKPAVIYPAITIAASLLIWTTNIFELVSIASRAFALFYLLQALLAARLALFQEQGVRRIMLALTYLALAVLMALIVIFAKAAA
jgi:hypothetical protein